MFNSSNNTLKLNTFMLSFIFIFYLFNNRNYFNFIYKIKSFKTSKLMMKMNWKW